MLEQLLWARPPAKAWAQGAGGGPVSPVCILPAAHLSFCGSVRVRAAERSLAWRGDARPCLPASPEGLAALLGRPRLISASPAHSVVPGA